MSDDEIEVYSDDELLDRAIAKVRAEDGRADPALEQTVQAVVQAQEKIIWERFGLKHDAALRKSYEQAKEQNMNVIDWALAVGRDVDYSLDAPRLAEEEKLLAKYGDGGYVSPEELKEVRRILRERNIS